MSRTFTLEMSPGDNESRVIASFSPPLSESAFEALQYNGRLPRKLGVFIAKISGLAPTKRNPLDSGDELNASIRTVEWDSLPYSPDVVFKNPLLADALGGNSTRLMLANPVAEGIPEYSLPNIAEMITERTGYAEDR